MWLKGSKLPPAASVLDNIYPDGEGRFTVKDVPLHPYSLAFVLDREIPVRLGIKDRIQVINAKFEKMGDLLKASLHVSYITYPHIQWEIQVRLLDETESC